MPIVAIVDSADLEQLDAVVDAIGRNLGTGVVGIYQYGSAVLGGLRPLSDLDVLVVVDRPTNERQRRDLVQGLLTVSGKSVGRPVEVTVVRQDRVRPWQAPMQREFQYGEWLSDEYESGQVPAPVVHPDLAALLSTALIAWKAIVGPPLLTCLTRFLTKTSSLRCEREFQVFYST